MRKGRVRLRKGPSRGTVRGTTAALLCALLTTFALVPLAPAAAEPASPVLTGVQLTSDPILTVGETASADFSLSEGAQTVRFLYTDESTVNTQSLWWDGDSESGPITATATTIVDGDFFAGEHTLQRIEITFPGGSVHYDRSGEITQTGDGEPVDPDSWFPDFTELDFAVDGTGQALRVNEMLSEPSIIGVPRSGFTLGVDLGRWSEPGPFELSWHTIRLAHWDLGRMCRVRVTWTRPGFFPVDFTTDPVGPVTSGEQIPMLGQMSVGSILRPDFDLGSVIAPEGVEVAAAFRWTGSAPIDRPSGPWYRIMPADLVPSEWGGPMWVAASLDVMVGETLLEGPSTRRNHGSTTWWLKSDSHFSSGFDDDGTPDFMTRDSSGQLRMYPTSGDGSWHDPRAIGWGWTGFSAILKAGDFNGDLHNDIIARNDAGELFLYPGDGTGGWLPPAQIGWGWNIFDILVAPGDFSGDGKNDIIGRTADGLLTMYPGDGKGSFYPPEVIGAGWGTMDTVFSPGDFDGNGYADILSRDRSGLLHFYGGNGGAGWTTTAVIGQGWENMSRVGSAGDFNGDGHPDVWAINSAGQLLAYYGDGACGWKGSAVVGWGWGGFTAVF
ncbi:FG-GAP repeat domain-containing protein [Arthrobacter sp. CDRTa11]|uniref:FG-GAP repeat domain-containing protein n=1 Tax=Arthrobacter sp. CDRTa11 TaxID=2651199 RepID=UPI002265BAB7|nr:VCBS repeat-containing protein [Arthrobacter sp. CDRTa11]